jgi:hypothetical protein
MQLCSSWSMAPHATSCFESSISEEAKSTGMTDLLGSSASFSWLDDRSRLREPPAWGE